MYKQTLVTGLWNLGREFLDEGWARSWETYTANLEKLLDGYNGRIIVFGEDARLKELVESYGQSFEYKSLAWCRSHFYSEIQKIRNSEDWLSQAGWLRNSTQAKLADYNAVVMSKPFLLNEARVIDQDQSNTYYWIDAGISTTVSIDLLENIQYIPDEKLTFISYPYEATNEVHGFNYKELCRLSLAKTEYVVRGGFFGGRSDLVEEFSRDYYSLMQDTLSSGFMGTEESLFTILAHTKDYNVTSVDANGLIYKFFKEIPKKAQKTTALYILTFNSPNQLLTLLESMNDYGNLLEHTVKYVLDNSTDESTNEEYKKICEFHNITRIKKDNIGICGGRQFIAEHFEESTHSEYFFFEDDMNFCRSPIPCKSGFIRDFGRTLTEKLVRIIRNKNYDFIKMSFSEFYGTNSEQWAWTNLPQAKRDEYFEGVTSKPLTKFNSIELIESLPIATGEVYYSNWPQLVSREGNKKMFLDTKWEHPYEQTWMSHLYQLTKVGKLIPAILLGSPIEHDRFEHYPQSERREN